MHLGIFSFLRLNMTEKSGKSHGGYQATSQEGKISLAYKVACSAEMVKQNQGCKVKEQTGRFLSEKLPLCMFARNKRKFVKSGGYCTVKYLV
jgi:hypothetical protein